MNNSIDSSGTSNEEQSVNVQDSHKCEICEKVFLKKNLLNSHIRKVHSYVQEKQHKCNICKKDFRRHDELKFHVRNSHENRKDHKCHLCVKMFSQASSLKLHIFKQPTFCYHTK